MLTTLWPTALTPRRSAPSAKAVLTSCAGTIGHGLVHVEPNWLSPQLIRAMRLDAQDLFVKGLFAPDGLTNTALRKGQQGFNVADRQTFRNDAWDAAVGDQAARLEFAEQMQHGQHAVLAAAELATCNPRHPHACSRRPSTFQRRACRVGPAVQPWSLSEAPPQTLVALPL